MDCGSGLGFPGEVALTTALVADGGSGGAMTYSFISSDNNCSDSFESSEDEFEKVFNDMFRFHGSPGERARANI